MITRMRIIKTYIPFEGNATPELESLEVIEASCPALRHLLDLLRQSDPIGRIGQYAAVYGVAFTAGGFTPLPGSNPVQGSIGETEYARTIELTTYAASDIPDETVKAFIEKMAGIHPWEHPVIDVYDTGMWMP